MKTKSIDCVEMKHHGAERIREKVAVLTLEQELSFWRERSDALNKRKKMVREERREQDPRVERSQSTPE